MSAIVLVLAVGVLFYEVRCFIRWVKWDYRMECLMHRLAEEGQMILDEKRPL